MKKRINQGIDNKNTSYGMMIVSEGTRHNLISETPFLSGDGSLVAISGTTLLGSREHAKFSQANTPIWIFKLEPKKHFQIKVTVNCNKENFGYTFSIYANISVGSILLKAILQDNTESKCEYFSVEKDLIRYEISHEFAETPNLVSIILEGEVLDENIYEPVELSLAFPVIEEGLFASSAILDGFRDGDQISIERNNEIFTGDSGTIFLIFVPQWTGPQLANEQLAFLFDCTSEDENNSVSIFSDGSDYGKIKGRIVVDGNIKIISTDIIPTRGTMYSVALRWVIGTVEVIINGRTTVLLDNTYLPCAAKLGKRIYYGSSSHSAYQSSFSLMACLKVYKEWISDENLRAISYEEYPAVYAQFELDWQNFINLPKLKRVTNESPAFPLFSLLLKLQRLWQKHPPSWLSGDKIDESDTRDEILRYLTLTEGSYECIPEEHLSEGRTDLLVRILGEQGVNVRVEFKVWGRHDYKEIPEKPLKYFSDGDEIGIVIMINSNKRDSINEKYRKNVNDSPTHCSQIVIEPFISDGYPYHFVSTHNSKNGHYAEVLHIVLNRQGPFATKELSNNSTLEIN